MEQRRDIENTKPACRLILASASPRRRELLERIGLKPEIHPSTLEENPLCTEPAQVVMELAGQKARDVMAQVRDAMADVKLAPQSAIRLQGKGYAVYVKKQ